MSVPLALSHPRKPLLPRSADREPQATEFLIANTRLKSELSGKDSSRLQISNRERIAIFHRVFLAFSSFEPPAPPEALAAVACPSWRAANRYSESSEWYHPSPPWSILEATHREIRISSLVQEGALTWGT